MKRFLRFFVLGVLAAVLPLAGLPACAAAPRVMGVSDAIDVANRVPRFVTDALEADGYTVKRSWMSYAFAALHGIRLRDGVLEGGADPQRDGMAMLVA